MMRALPPRTAVRAGLAALLVAVSSGADAAFELRMGTSARDGLPWTESDRPPSGIRLRTRHMNPYRVEGLRFDGFELAGGRWALHGGQLGADGYRERSCGLRLGSDGGPWILGEVFASGPSSGTVRNGGVRPRGGASASLGHGFGLGPWRATLAALDLARSGDALLPPPTWRAGGEWRIDPGLALCFERAWTDGAPPRARFTVSCRPVPAVRLDLGLDGEDPAGACRVAGGDIEIAVSVRTHGSLPPTTSLELSWFFRAAGDGTADREPARPHTGPEIESSSAAVSRASQARAGDGTARWGPTAASEAPPSPLPWELEPEEARLLERPWEIGDTLSVWETRSGSLGASPAGSLGGSSSPLDARDAEPADAAERAAANGARTIDRRAEPRRIVHWQGGVVEVPVPLDAIGRLDRWPTVPDSLWRLRRDAWNGRFPSDGPRSLEELASLPVAEQTFWRRWAPYLTTLRPPAPRPATAWIEWRTRTAGTASHATLRWTGRVPAGGATWDATGGYDASTRRVRGSLRGARGSWRWQGVWGAVRGRPGLDVDLSRSREGDGGWVSLLRGGPWGGGLRIGADGADLLLSARGLELGTASSGLWQARVTHASLRAGVTRSAGGAWFLELGRETISAGRARLRLDALERFSGAGAASRSQARSLRFDRRVAVRTADGIRFALRWRKSVAGPDPDTNATALHTLHASSETREFQARIPIEHDAGGGAVDLRVRRAANRSRDSVPARVSSFFFRYRGWLPWPLLAAARGPTGSSRDAEEEASLGWEFTLRGTLRADREVVHSLFAVHQERRAGSVEFALGWMEVLGPESPRVSLDPSWAELRPRSVPGGTRWGAGSVRARLGKVRLTLGGMISIGGRRDEAQGELRVRLEEGL